MTNSRAISLIIVTSRDRVRLQPARMATAFVNFCEKLQLLQKRTSHSADNEVLTWLRSSYDHQLHDCVIR